MFQGKQKASRQSFLCPPGEQVSLALLQRLNQVLEASVHTKPGQQFSPRPTRFGPRGKGGEKWIQEDNPVTHLLRAQWMGSTSPGLCDFKCRTVEPMFWVSSLNMEEALPIMRANQSCPGQSHVLSGKQSLFPSTHCPPSRGLSSLHLAEGPEETAHLPGLQARTLALLPSLWENDGRRKGIPIPEGRNPFPYLLHGSSK